MRTKSTFRDTLLRLPLFLLLVGIASASMIVPSVHALVLDDLETSRAFFYSGLLGLIAFALISVAHAGRLPKLGALGPLLSMFSALVFLPGLLAIPFFEALPTTRFINVYFEMVSAITTTGATMFRDPERLNDTLHLWRAQVGWMGGLLMWVAASAILAPLHLGGFEVTSQAEPGRWAGNSSVRAPADQRQRLIRVTKALLPIYVGLTVLLWLLLMGSGDVPLVALCHAMSVLATSGISPIGGIPATESGLQGEVLMVMFMLFALSRLTFSKDTVTATQGGLLTDPEFRIGILIVIGVPVILFARHFLGAFEVGASQGTFIQAFAALWGGVFTVMSFLTTTGFVSGTWDQAQSWSGLETSGLILMGLALIGGGVATTAGGVKLLRVYALYHNGTREMERLVHPSSVNGASQVGKRLQSNGAFIAWVFFMLFAISLAGICLLLTLSGADFDEAMVLSVAMLSTTGPLVENATEAPIRLIEMGYAAKAVLCAAMVLGRLETLAIIALLTPDLWRG